jgi:hypothetical protein
MIHPLPDQAAALVRPWCADRDRNPRASEPWEQRVGNQWCMCAVNPIAAAWVPLAPIHRGAFPPFARYVTAPVPRHPSEEIATPPDIELIIPRAIAPVDVTEIMRNARKAATAGPRKASLLNHGVVLVTADRSHVYIYFSRPGDDEEVATFSAVDCAPMLSLNYAATRRLPPILSALQYDGEAIVMHHEGGLWSMLMPRTI